MTKINLNFNQYLELEKLGSGVFKPVKNFMKKKEFYNVVNKMKFKKEIFPIPIFLDISENKKKKKIKKKIINKKKEKKIFQKKKKKTKKNYKKQR